MLACELFDRPALESVIRVLVSRDPGHVVRRPRAAEPESHTEIHRSRPRDCMSVSCRRIRQMRTGRTRRVRLDRDSRDSPSRALHISVSATWPVASHVADLDRIVILPVCLISRPSLRNLSCSISARPQSISRRYEARRKRRNALRCRSDRRRETSVNAC